MHLFNNDLLIIYDSIVNIIECVSVFPLLADQDLLKKQQDCVLLLQHITQEIPDEQLQTLGASYDIESNYQQYDNPILVKYYVRAVQVGLVQPRGTVYSNSISRLRKEVALLHRVFLSATNYQTFISTAAWARVHVNKEQFIKAFIGAVLQRPDTEDIILPPLYEIIPHYYFDARIIQEIHDIIGHGIGHDNVIVPVNYTAYLPNGEHQVSYFTQDIGLANYYGYINLAGYLLHKVCIYNFKYQKNIRYSSLIFISVCKYILKFSEI